MHTHRKFGHVGRLLACWLLLSTAWAQTPDVTIRGGRTDIAINEPYTLTVTVGNADLKTYGTFPEIRGFRKASTSSSTSTNIINGKVSYTQSVTQNYLADREGTFTLPDFTMEINGEPVRGKGATIRVGPPRQAQRGASRFGRDPFEEFFGQGGAEEFVEVKADAFLAFTTDKPEVYVGEGFTATLALYISEENQADLQFYELVQQYGEIVKKLKPANSWEENFNIEEIQGQPIRLNSKNYKQYKIFQAAYYPLNTDPVEFPRVGLKLIKYKVAKNPTFFGRNRQEDFQTFYTEPRSVRVRPLPPHPLRDGVAVGEFRLNEEINPTELETGQSLTYDFQVRGEGNISSINTPTQMQSRTEVDFYAPNTRQSINRSQNKVTGYKTFSYQAVPQEPGTYQMKDFFQWVYFDPERARYDTLRPQASFVVTGESIRDRNVTGSARDEFYSVLAEADNRTRARTGPDWGRWLVNGLVGLLLVGAVVVLFTDSGSAANR